MICAARRSVHLPIFVSFSGQDHFPSTGYGSPISSEPAMIIGSSSGLLLTLWMGHCLGDYAFQSDRMAVEKCAGCDQTLPWYWWLGSHAGIHAFLVTVITGMPWLGLAEWILHASIDLCKCRRFFGLVTDQFLHLFCKLIWVIIAAQFTSLPLLG